MNCILSGMTLHNYCCARGEIVRLDDDSSSSSEGEPDDDHAGPGNDPASRQRDAIAAYLEMGSDNDEE